MTDLTILLPALNEEVAIGLVIDEIRKLPFPCEVLVIDNGSTDKTVKLAKSKNVKVVSESEKGKGNAIRRGIGLVSTPYVVMVNSDYTYPIQDIRVVYALLCLEGMDVVIGCRQLKEPGSMGAANSFGNWGLSLMASILYRHGIYDLCTGMWGFKTEKLKEFDITSRDFTLEADLFINALRHGCRIEQIPIGYRKRLDGSHPKLKIWDGFKIARHLLVKRWKR